MLLIPLADGHNGELRKSVLPSNYSKWFIADNLVESIIGRKALAAKLVHPPSVVCLDQYVLTLISCG